MAEQDSLAFYRLAVRRLRSLGVSGRVVDIGCGSGYGTRILQDAGFTAFGIDISDCAIRDTHERGVEAYLHHYERTRRVPPFVWDASVCCDVVGWYGEDPRVQIENMKRDAPVALVATTAPEITLDWLRHYFPEAILNTIPGSSMVYAELLRGRA